MGATTTFVHFAVDGDRLAVSLEEVREVARVTQVTPVPRASSIVRGVANIRGRVVTLLDADALYARRTGGKPAAPSGTASSQPHGHAIVFSAPREHLALFTRSRVDLGRGEETPVSGEPPGPAPQEAAPPPGALLTFGDDMVRLLPAAGIAAHCEARILERYRRRG